MKDAVTVQATIQVELDVRQVAQAFAAMDDEQQTRFFVILGELAHEWGPGRLGEQFFKLGRHLRDCACSSYYAQEIVEAMANGYEFDNIKSGDYRADPVNQPENIR